MAVVSWRFCRVAVLFNVRFVVVCFVVVGFVWIPLYLPDFEKIDNAWLLAKVISSGLKAAAVKTTPSIPTLGCISRSRLLRVKPSK